MGLPRSKGGKKEGGKRLNIVKCVAKKKKKKKEEGHHITGNQKSIFMKKRALIG